MLAKKIIAAATPGVGWGRRNQTKKLFEKSFQY